jgi:hypothetical protein
MRSKHELFAFKHANMNCSRAVANTRIGLLWKEHTRRAVSGALCCSSSTRRVVQGARVVLCTQCVAHATMLGLLMHLTLWFLCSDPDASFRAETRALDQTTETTTGPRLTTAGSSGPRGLLPQKTTFGTDCTFDSLSVRGKLFLGVAFARAEGGVGGRGANNEADVLLPTPRASLEHESSLVCYPITIFRLDCATKSFVADQRSFADICCLRVAQ